MEEAQKKAWIHQIEILKLQLSSLKSFHIAFEYTIPRMGKRVDVVILYSGCVFLLEFKVGDKTYTKAAINQVLDYSLDLKNFHEQSHSRQIVPIVVATEAPNINCKYEKYPDGIWHPINANKSNIIKIIREVSESFQNEILDETGWFNSIYKPTPTIIEAAQALYKGHTVTEISRSDSGAINLAKTSREISKIIEHSKAKNKKSICFVTGVPGSGKTLAGLNIANERQKIDNGEHAVFLSGNGPLVDVLSEALARNEVTEKRLVGQIITKSQSLRKVKSFIQNIHHFRDDSIQTKLPPNGRVVVFDEAQRAWTSEQARSFMDRKRGVINFNMSEPEFLISVLDRHKDWATIICLVGGGQEINTGEAGLPEWFDALSRKHTHWDIYVSDKISDIEYTNNNDLFTNIAPDRLKFITDLHLSVSVRSFRTERIALFVKSLLDLDAEMAKSLYAEIQNLYQIAITRCFHSAKEWLRNKARGRERCGITAYSGAYRLKPEGIHVKLAIDPRTWFLNDTDDVRSSSFLEDAATEFDIQGLELDWTCVAWDASLRLENNN